MPENFIQFVLSGLDQATSCFKTFYGLTEDFKVETSVRQGDPLSPLIYILVVDALHEGWRDNPLYFRKTGYRFSNNKTLRISSTGYADDAIIYAENWGDIWANGPESSVGLMVSKLAPKQNTSFLIARAQETLDGFQLSKVGESFTPKTQTLNSDILAYTSRST